MKTIYSGNDSHVQALPHSTCYTNENGDSVIEIQIAARPQLRVFINDSGEEVTELVLQDLPQQDSLSVGTVVTSTGNTVAIPGSSNLLDTSGFEVPPVYPEKEMAIVGNITTPNLSAIPNNSMQKEKVIEAFRNVPETTPLVAKMTNSYLLDDSLMDCPPCG